MTDSKQIEKALFEAARELDAPEMRAAFLDQTCQGNTGLRERLEKLLTVEVPAEEFFSVSPVHVAGADAGLDAPPAAPSEPVQSGDVSGLKPRMR